MNTSSSRWLESHGSDVLLSDQKAFLLALNRVKLHHRPSSCFPKRKAFTLYPSLPDLQGRIHTRVTGCEASRVPWTAIYYSALPLPEVARCLDSDVFMARISGLAAPFLWNLVQWLSKCVRKRRL